MSETPRTDAAAVGFGRLLVDRGTPEAPKFETTELVPANFARTLERELDRVTHLWKAASMKLGEQREAELTALRSGAEREALADAYAALQDAIHATAIYGDEPPQLYRDALAKVDAALSQEPKP